MDLGGEPPDSSQNGKNPHLDGKNRLRSELADAWNKAFTRNPFFMNCISGSAPIRVGVRRLEKTGYRRSGVWLCSDEEGGAVVSGYRFDCEEPRWMHELGYEQQEGVAMVVAGQVWSHGQA